MRKIKLLRDIPGFKAGTVFQQTVRDTWYPVGENTSHSYVNELFMWDEMKGIWFEEVKRETWHADEGAMWYAVTFMPAIGVTDFPGKDSSMFDEPMHKYGNYFKSTSTASKVADAQKLLFKWIHRPKVDSNNPTFFGTSLDVDFADLLKAMNAARDAVTRDDEDERTSIC